MTADSATKPRQPSARPSTWRLVASWYVDLLICGFLAWVVCFTFGWQSSLTFLTLILWFGETLYCRDRLNPTAGEYCLGIRYLTSSSSQVVADIQIIHKKLVLNAYILIAGVVDLTLAILCFCGWTFFSRSVVCGIIISPPGSLIYWIVAGLALFFCSGSLLSGSKTALWIVPLFHALFFVDFFLSYTVWKQLMMDSMFYTPYVSVALITLAKTQNHLFLNLIGFWSAFIVGVVAFSRKHLIN